MNRAGVRRLVSTRGRVRQIVRAYDRGESRGTTQVARDKDRALTGKGWDLGDLKKKFTTSLWGGGYI